MTGMVSAMASRIWSQVGDMELYTAILLCAMIAMWTIGSIANRRIANSAFHAFSSTLESQFVEPGKLAKESNSHYFTYSTGRVRCSGLALSLHLSPRQDFLSRFVISWMSKSWYSPDRVSIEVRDVEMDNCATGLVCRKFMAPRLTEKLPDISKYGKPSNGVLEGGSFSSASPLTGFTLICDAGGKAVGPSLFGKGSPVAPPSVLSTLQSIHFAGSSRSVIVDLSVIPSTSGEWKEIIDYVLYGLVDSLASVRVSEQVRAEVTAQRNAQAEKLSREEEAAKREEQKRKEREAKTAQMSAAELEKLNEKRKRKDMKKRGGRVISM